MRNVVVIAIISLAVVGCRFSVGVPTDQEVQQMQSWSEVVTPKDRVEVMQQASGHTEWAERRRVQWITGEYKKRYMKEQARAARSTHHNRADDNIIARTLKRLLAGTCRRLITTKNTEALSRSGNASTRSKYF